VRYVQETSLNDEIVSETKPELKRLILDSETTGNMKDDVSELIDTPRSELTELELQKLEEFEFSHGPMSLIQLAMTNSTPIVVSCRNNHKLIGTVKAFDRHCNLIMENVKELWTETVRNTKGKKIKSVNKERFVSKMFLRGDSVVIVLKA